MWEKLKKDYQNHANIRSLVIQESNQALNKAKQSIFLLHRDQLIDAEKTLKQVEKILNKIHSYFKKVPDLEYNGPYKAALEEYLEAKLFWQVLKFNKIELIKEVKVNHDDYLGAICDLTGEIVRKMILLVINEEEKKAKDLKNLITEIINKLIRMDLTGYLRHKYDEAKRNLKKAEEILYDLKIRK
ncbi:MAG: hypothetical protein PHW15_03230 [Patescibacteria group bacterium]|jgi:predicted translin family RNA/ssDNA-binding protein|nr:hypothetical protein [Patescibacteria group bacterium]MDD5172552.1 hypothetical protein [Patescibacteria group bacterium]